MTNANAARRHTVEYAGQTFSRTSKHVYAFAIVGETMNNWHDAAAGWAPAVLGWSANEANAHKAAAGFRAKDWNRNVTIIPVGA